MFKYILAVILIALIWAIVIVVPSIPQWIAVVATLVIVGILVALVLYRRYRAIRAARDIERALSLQADEHARSVRPEQQAEIRAMQAEFNKAIGALKASKLGKAGNEALYQLPWYAIIGPPGTGKSTALRNSGLQFPYLSQSGGGVRGVGGTRNCDWWLTNEGVILDTAGRYTSDEDDRDEWFAFLDMLKQFRPQKPINGILVAVSAADLGGAREEEIVRQARTIRERIDEVMGRLQMVVPVYVLFTKCDLVPGFVEMFSDLRKTERGQIWGFTVPLGQRVTDPSSLFAERFDELTGILGKRSVKRLNQERRIDVREKIYEFPQQFEVLRNNLADFVGNLFSENVYQGAPIMRGVYFTSGTQEGRPIDRVMASMAEAFGVRNRPTATSPTQPVTEQKSYFLRDVFANVVFPDADVAARSASEIARARRKRFQIAAGAFGVALLLSVIPAYAYMQNRNLLESTTQIAGQLAANRQAVGPNTPMPIERLEPLRLRVEELAKHHRDGAPLHMRFGMYQGDTIYPHVRDLYTSTLRRDVIEPIVRRITEDLNTFGNRYAQIQSPPPADEHGRYHRMLKAYLLLTVPAEPSQPALNNDLQRWLSQELVERWAALSSAGVPSAETQQTMLKHAQTYTGLLANDQRLAFARSPQVVRGARDAMNRTPVEFRALAEIIGSVDRSYDISLATIVGETVTVVTSATNAFVRGAFTRRAWNDRVRERLRTALDQVEGETWVLGREGRNPVQEARDREARLLRLRSDYFNQYINEWRQFILSLRVETPNNNQRALEIIQELTRGEPVPYAAIAQAVSFNAHLEEPEETAAAGIGGAAAAGLARQAEIRLRNALSGTFGQQGARDMTAAGRAAAAAQAAGPGQPQYTFRQDVIIRLRGFWRFGANAPAPPPPPQQPGQPAPPPPPPAAVPLDQYQEQLVFVRNELINYANNPNGDTAPLINALATAQNRVRAMVDQQEIGWRPAFEQLLPPPIQFAVQHTVNSIGGGTGDRWCTSVAIPFMRTLHGRYPFNRDGHDAALADVADFYRRETGTLWAFYDRYLRTDVPRVGEQHQFSTRLGTGAGQIYRDELRTFLDRSIDIQTVMFPAGQTDPRVDFEVRIRPSPTIANIVFTVDGQVAEHHNGPEQWVSMRWPGEGRNRGASIRALGINGIDETIQQDGEWGIFRLLELGEVSGAPGARIFQATWTLRDQRVQIGVDIRPARTENPFLGIPRRDNSTAQILRPYRSPEADVPLVIARAGGNCNVSGEVPAAPSRRGRRNRRRRGEQAEQAAQPQAALVRAVDRAAPAFV